MKKYYIFDFDSTFVQTESLEELFAYSLANDPDRQTKVQQIQEITNLGMEGKLDFGESLKHRMKLLKANKTDVQKVAQMLTDKVSPSIQRNKEFFQKKRSVIYIISGGFKEIIWQVVKDFGILENHILANEFIYKDGQIIGYNQDNFCAKTNGKALAVKNLKLNGEVIIIGDGMTDYQIKQQGYADYFYAFTENISRDPVVKVADKVLNNLDQLIT